MVPAMATKESLVHQDHPGHLDHLDQPFPWIASIAMMRLPGITQQLKGRKESVVIEDFQESQERPLILISTHSRMN